MAFDSGVAVKAIDANPIEHGDIIVAVEPNGGYQSLDQSDDFGEPQSQTAMSGQFYDRMDNKGYY